MRAFCAACLFLLRAASQDGVGTKELGRLRAFFLNWLLERLEDCDDDVPNMMLLQTHQVEPERGSILLDKKIKKDGTAESIFKQKDLVMAYAAWLRLGAVILHHPALTVVCFFLLWRIDADLIWFWALLKQMRCPLLPSTTTSDRKCCAIYWRREGTKAESRALLWGFANRLLRFCAKLGCAGRRDAVERAIHEAQCFVRADLSVASVAFGFGTVVKVSAGPAPGQFRQQHVVFFRFRFYNSTLAERKERGGVFLLFSCFYLS